MLYVSLRAFANTKKLNGISQNIGNLKILKIIYLFFHK